MKKIAVILLVVLLLVVGAYLGVGYLLYDRLSAVADTCAPHQANLPSSFKDANGTWGDGLDFEPYFIPTYETVRFASREEGIDIAGWFFAGDVDAPAVVVVHGFGSCKHAPQVLLPASILWRNGFNVLVIDVRDVGDSTQEDGRTAIGNEEFLDVLGAWDWLAAEKEVDPDRIGLLGNSLGAATVMNAFSQEPGVPAIFVDSPPDNLGQIISEELARNNVPQFMAPGILFMARIVAGDDLLAHNPGDAVANSDGRPMFVLHGLADARIDPRHSLQIQARAAELGVDNVTVMMVEGVDHIRMARYHTEEYEKIVVDFFRQALDG